MPREGMVRVAGVLLGVPDRMLARLRSGVFGRYVTLREASSSLMQRLVAFGHDVPPNPSPEEMARIRATLAAPALAEEHT